MLDPDYFLVIVSLLIIFIALFLLVYFLSKNSYETKQQANIAAQVATCPPGLCATNILTGVKTCPANSADSVLVNEANEVCSSPFLCDNPLLPYSLLSDGSTSFSGNCETGVQCPCLAQQRCPEYIVSVFTAGNGDPYSELSGQRITFPQTSLSIPNSGGSVTDNTPLVFTNPSTTFCTVPVSYLNFSSPGCQGYFTTTFDIQYDDLVSCMLLPNGGVSGCSGGVPTFGDPCLQGTLAFITSNSAGLTQADINTTPMGCSRGTACPCAPEGEPQPIAIYDTSLGEIVCRSLT